MKKQAKNQIKNQLKKVVKLTDTILGILLLIVSDIIFCVAYYILKFLKNINFYEILYYLNSDATGTGTSVIVDGIKACYIVFIVILVLLILPITSSKNKKVALEIGKKEIKLYPNKFNKFKTLYALVILVFSVLVISKTINFDEYYIVSKESGDIYESKYVETGKVKVQFPEEKRNLILIYLESMESSLFSTENGGAFTKSRIPQLEKIAKENISFSHNSNLGGAYTLSSTAWTIASTVASTSGTPLLVSVGNDYNKVESFMPSVVTLGDILHKEGYNQEIIQGTSIDFAGTDKYFSLHGNPIILDYNAAIEKEYISDDYYVWWGYEDKKLFKYAKSEIESLSEKEEPFAVSIFTMDTHFKDGYLDPSCSKPFTDQMSNVYNCSSKMINDFLDWIKEQDFYENTTIVLMGDHLLMQGEYYKDNLDYERTVYNAFINSKASTTNIKNRKFSVLDMYPTILASLGATIEGEQLGFGVNLFSNKKTLIEEMGKDEFQRELLKKSTYYIDNILKDSILDKIEEEKEENEQNVSNNDIISTESGE